MKSYGGNSRVIVKRRSSSSFDLPLSQGSTPSLPASAGKDSSKVRSWRSNFGVDSTTNKQSSSTTIASTKSTEEKKDKEDKKISNGDVEVYWDDDLCRLVTRKVARSDTSGDPLTPVATSGLTASDHDVEEEMEDDNSGEVRAREHEERSQQMRVADI